MEHFFMPVILRIKGYIFFFYSNEGTPREPKHIHVRNTDAEAKFWLIPFVTLARNAGFSPRERNELENYVKQYRKLFIEAWYGYFS
ncbi:DUF4160 domain-containing protein [Cedecea davisae]|uniref:DUF4160 domain-containing protein n=2 Tax=Cedecea davisae TaxID=158484 RepID=S3IRB9_9ENTR|nr:hypothetical protein HMPREF0201_03248 [Cedecea davisae DSM 4568]